MLIINAKIFDGVKFIEEDAILIEGDKIKKVLKSSELCCESKNEEIFDAKGSIVSPGFIDLQINGCGGVLFNDEINRESLEIMNKTNMKYGCTSFLPTLITSPDDKIIKALDLIKNMEDKEKIGVLGLHIEGPYISLEKKGIHRPDYVRVLEDKIIDAIADLGYEGVKIMTIAPEKAKIEHLEKLTKSGIHLAIGHTNATYNQCLEKEKYYTTTTHLYNGMSLLGSREPGVVGYLFDRQKQYVGIIVDGMHSDFAAVRIAKNNLKDKLYLVTDAVSPMGTDMKEFMFEGNLVYHKEGKCFSPTGTLAGSALDMITGVKNLTEEVGLEIEESLRMATSYPAKVINVDNRYGHIKEGYIANITIFNDNYKILGTMQFGKMNKYI